MKEIRRVEIPQGDLREWFFLALRESWNRYLCARDAPRIQAGRIQLNAIAKSSRNLGVPVSISVSAESSSSQRVEISSPPESPIQQRQPTFVLARPARRISFSLNADLRIGANSIEKDQDEVATVVAGIAKVFQESAVALQRERQEYVIAMAFEADKNWPAGFHGFGSRMVFSKENTKSFSPRYAVFCQRVSGTSANECLARYQSHMVAGITLLGILCGRMTKVCQRTELDSEFFGSGLPSLPMAEHIENSRLIKLGKEQPDIRSGSAYGGGSLEAIHSMPDDLAAMFDAFDSLGTERSKVLRDSLNAFQFGLRFRDRIPTAAMAAFWTALETLVRWDPRITKEGDFCPTCKKRPSRTQGAIIDLMVSSLKLPKETETKISDVLRSVRESWRNPWVHLGVLPGLDFEELPEVWFASTEKKSPPWARADYLMSQLEDFIRQIIVTVIEAERRSRPVETTNSSCH